MSLRHLLLVSVLLPATAHATTIVVDTTTDEDNSNASCSLREAIIAADSVGIRGACPAGRDDDTIVLPEGTFTLTTALALRDVTVVGAGPRTSLRPGAQPIDVDGAVTLRDLEVRAAQHGAVRSTHASLRAVRVQFTDNAEGAVVVAHDGTGIRPSLTLQQCLVSSSSGTAAVRTNAGAVRIEGSAFVDNAAGAIALDGTIDDAALVSNSTFSGNHAFERGGAITTLMSTSIDSCTFIGNSADIEGGAVFSSVAVEARNSLWLNNAAPAGPTCALLSDVVFSAGHNLVDDVSGCAFLPFDDDVIVDELAAVVFDLTAAGGPVPSFLPVENGAAHNTGECALEVDQRGARRLDGACDIGAVERDGLFLDAVVTVQPTTTECTHGGIVVASGVDDGAGVLADAGDGALSAAELDREDIVCTTTDAPLLVSVQSGTVSCANGGVLVHSGHDDDGNGVLDVGERERTDTVCNGAPGTPGVPGEDGNDGNDGNDGDDGQNGGAGASSLLRTTPVSAGDDGCSAGGQRIEGGVDDGAGGGTAGDGILDDGEVDTTAIICNGVSFQDEFETSGGGSCASGATPVSWIGAVLLLARRRRR
jgi:CSLREA domain-containing protein